MSEEVKFIISLFVTLLGLVFDIAVLLFIHASLLLWLIFGMYVVGALALGIAGGLLGDD